MEWHEDPTLEHLGMLESGSHSIYEFEVYRRTDGSIVCCDHDSPDDIMSLADVKTFFEDGDDIEEFNRQTKELGI